MFKQRVLVLDIETFPMLAWVWGRKDVNISLSQIKQDWTISAWSAKWLDAPAKSIVYMDCRNNTEREILKPLRGLLDMADIVLTHNGTSFDAKKINARLILLNMKPPRPYKHIDTLRLVRQVADFTSSSLEYLTHKLCTKYKKLSHAKFPGMELWKACMADNPKAWDEMRKYNIHDVLSLEEFYLKVRAWSPESTPAIYPCLNQCPVCGSDKLHQRGFYYTRQSKVKRIRCMSCGAWSRGPREKL